MDYIKIGKINSTLRKEKSMTQKHLGDILNLSDRTISKWERGIGCPDVSILNELSKILDVNIDKLLLRELYQNEVEGGNMKKIKFYTCKNCNDVAFSTNDMEVSWCGRKLECLEIKSVDNNHLIDVKDIENDYFINIEHSMTKDHYISFIVYVDCDRVLFIKLYPEQNPEVRFPKMRKGKQYILCSKHGLYSKSL